MLNFQLTEVIPADWPSRLLFGLVPLLLGALVTLLKGRKKEIALRGKIVTLSAIQDMKENPALSVRYGSNKIPNLNVTTALIWNAGRKEIRTTNVASGHPLALSFPEGTQILESKMLFQTHESRGAQVATNPADELQLEFEFLNPLDAILIHCLHTGPVEEVELVGELVGPSVNLDHEWESQVGIHGETSGTHVINWKLFSTMSAVIGWLEVATLVLAFVFQNWATVVALTAVLAFFALAASWRSNPVPRKVRRDLNEFVKEQQRTAKPVG